MKKEDKISLVFLVIFTLGVSNLILNLAVKSLNIFLTVNQAMVLLLVISLFTIAIVLSSKEKILKNKYYNYFKEQISLFLQTFKEWKLLIKGIIIDIFTMLSIFLIIFLAINFLKWNFGFLEQIPGFLTAAQSYAQTGTPLVDSSLQQEMQKNASRVNNAIIFSMIATVIAYLLIILSVGFFQGLLYSKFTKQKFDRKFIRKFSILNLILALTLTFLIILAGAKLKSLTSPKIIVFLLFLFFYLGLISFSLFNKNEKILRMIKSSLKFAFKKIYLFFTPFIIAYMFTYVLLFIIGSLGNKFILSQLVFGIVYALIIIIFITWLKFFTVKIARSIKNE